MKNLKVCLISLGCEKNLVDSENILGLFDLNQYEITNDKFAFTSTNGAIGNERNRVTYTYSEQDGSLRRKCQQKNGTVINDRALSSAKVSSFSVVIGDNNRFITVTLEVDNERDNQIRTFNSKGNKIQLKAVLYPRFLTETLTDEEMYWHKTQLVESTD